MDETEQGNIFDQFDSPAQPQAAQANVFDQFDETEKPAEPKTIGDKVSAFTGTVNNDMTSGGMSDGKPVFKETEADPKAIAAIGDAGVTGDTAPDFGQDTEGYAQRQADAAQHLGEAGKQVAGVVGKTALGVAAGLGKDATKLTRTAALLGGVLPAGYDAIVGGHSAYDTYAENNIAPLDRNLESIEDFAKDRGRAGEFGAHVGELGGDLALMASGAGEVNAAAKAGEGSRAIDILGTALDRSADASKIVATQQAAQQVEGVQQGGGSKLQSAEAGLTTFATNVIANAIPAGIDGTLADRLGAGAVGGAVTGEFQRQINNVVLPESMKQDFDAAGAGWNILMQAGMGAVFHRAEMENPNKVATDFNEIQRQAEAGNPTAKRTADIVSNLTSVDGLNGSAIAAGKLASVVHDEAMNTPHESLLTGSSRYGEIYNSAVDSLGVDGAQAYAKATYANETSTNAAWDSYFAAQNIKTRADLSSKVTQQINDMHEQAMQVVPVAEMQKLRRWAFDNQRTPLEVRKALYDTINERVAPDYIQDQYGEHFNDDGTLSQKAFESDSAMRPDTQHATYEDTPEVRQALVEGGVAPYKLDDGRLAVIGQPRDLNTLTDHVETRSGKLPSNFGESHEVQAAKNRPEDVVETAGPDAGDEGRESAAGRGDAEDRKSTEGGRIDEGNHEAENRVSTERIKKAGEVIDTRLAALDESAKGMKSKRDMARLGRERDELEDLVRAQADAKTKGVQLAPGNRMSDAELSQAHARMDEIKLAIEGHRRAVTHGAEGASLREKLSKAEDSDLVRIADNITNPRRAHVADQLDGTPGVTVSSRGEARIYPNADPEAANKAMDVAASDTGANTTDFAEPTARQAAAGNYRKGGVMFKSPKGDLRVRIENPEGSIRKGKGWSRPVRGAHYGYIPDTVGADGDPLDVFLSRNAHDDSRPIAVISQHDPKTGKFDELKVVMGAKSRAEAMELYGRQYPPGIAAKMLPDGKRNVVMMDRAKFKKFLDANAADVPPHPVSGEPMLKYRTERERDTQQAQLEADRKTASAEAHAAMNRKVETKDGAEKPKDETSSSNNEQELNKLPSDMQELLSSVADDQGVDLPKSFPLRKASIDDFPYAKIGGRGDSRDIDYVTSMAKDSDKLPPVIVADGRLIDGRHRIEALRMAGAKEVSYVDATGYLSVDKTLDSGPAPRAKSGESPRYIFGGEKARTADKAAGETARTMESMGDMFNRDDILTKTGWFRGADGRMKFEISDEGANVEMSALNSHLKARTESANKIQKLIKDRNEAGDSAEKDKYTQEILKANEEHESTETPRLNEVLDHSELWKAYPEIGEKVKIRTERLPLGEGGFWDASKMEIVMNSDPNNFGPEGDPRSFKAVLLHEVQHVVQSFEGFARGGSQKEFVRVLKTQREVRLKMRDRISSQIEAAKANHDQKMVNKLEADLAYVEKTIDDMGNPSDFTRTAFKQYRALAGEVEARNVQARHTMTADERASLRPYDTQDHANADQKVILGNEISMNERDTAHRDMIANHVAEISRKWKSSPQIEVVHNRDELPEFLKSQVAMQMGGEIHPDGIYHDGKVYLLSDNIIDTAHAERVVLHETMGHLGLRGTFGDKLNPLLDSIHASLAKSGKLDALRAEYGAAYGHMDDQALNRAIAEEHLAQLAESNLDPSAWAKVAAGLRKVLRSMGIVREWSDNDLRVLVAGVARDVREGRVSLAGQEPPQATFDDENGTVSSTYKGAAGEGTVEQLYDGTERLLRVDGLEAHLEPFLLDGQPALAVRAMRIASPSDLLRLTRFAGEEGKGVVAVEKETLSRRNLERSGIPFKDAGSHWVMPASQGMPDSPMYSMRNRAKGTPAQEEILKRAMIHAAEANLTPWDKMQATMRSLRDDVATGNTQLRLKQAYVDALAPIDKYERAANGGMLLDAAQSAYKSAWMAKNNEQITAGVMKLGVPEFRSGTFTPVAGRKGLLDIFSPLYKTLDGKAQDILWEGYAMARRSSELIQQTNKDGTSREKLLDQADINHLLDLETKYPHFKKVFDEYQAFNKQLLDLAVERGTLSKDSADLWSKNMYVPFYRHMDDQNESNEWRTGKGIAGKRVTSMKLTGSDKMVEPIIENIIKNTGSILDKVYANEAMRRVVALTDGIGMEKVKIPWEGQELSAGEIEKALGRIGLHVGSKVNGKYLNHVAAADMDKLVTFFKMTKPQGPDIISVMEGGKPYYYRVNDTQLYRAVTAFNDIGSFDKVLGAILGVPKKLITAGVTLDPRFMYRNLIRDGMTAWAQTGTNPNMVKGMSANIKEIATDGAFLNRLRVAGYNGNEYFKLNEMRDFMEQMHGKKWTLLSTPKQLWRGYHKIGAISEQMNRMRIAKHTIENGGSMAEAAWQAQNTLNFSMRGDSRAFQLLIRAVPFLNARVQGLSRLYDGATGRDVTVDRQRAVTSFLMKMAGVMAAGGALTAYNWDDKRYQRIPDAAKDTYYHFFIGDHHFTIPKPFEIGTLMTTLPERTARWMGGKDNDRTYVESLQRMFGSVFSFDPTPQIVKPWIEDWANKDSFSGAPIVNQQLSGLQAPAQYNPQTSPTIKAIAHKMPWFAPDVLRSPVRLEHMIHGYTAQIGQYAVQAADAIARGTGAAPAGPQSRYGNKWLGAVEGTFGQGEDATDPRNKYMQQLYDAQDNVDAAYKTFDAYVKQGRIEEARELMHTSKTPLAYRNAIKATVKEMGELRKIETSIYADEHMSEAQKREQLNKITAVKQKYLENAAPMIEIASDYYH